MEYLIRFAQFHETFRQPEVNALAVLINVEILYVSYSEAVSPFAQIGALQATFLCDPYCSFLGQISKQD